jgi:hypothetical protein
MTLLRPVRLHLSHLMRSRNNLFDETLDPTNRDTEDAKYHAEAFDFPGVGRYCYGYRLFREHSSSTTGLTQRQLDEPDR